MEFTLNGKTSPMSTRVCTECTAEVLEALVSGLLCCEEILPLMRIPHNATSLEAKTIGCYNFGTSRTFRDNFLSVDMVLNHGGGNMITL